MAKLVLLTGPQAVGKMTVGQELTKITNLKLFHNHMTIDLVSNFFSYGTRQGESLVYDLRMRIFEEVAKSDLYGIIFTFTMAYNCVEDVKQIQAIENIFKENGGEVYYIELEAPLDIRLERNKTENRLKNKTSKRNIEFSEKLIFKAEEKYRMNSFEGEVKEKNYMKIDNSNLPADVVAKMIKEKFRF